MKRIIFPRMFGVLASSLWLASALLAARAEFFNVNTKEHAKVLPRAIKVNGNVILDPSLKEAAVIGWREVPEVKAAAGEQIVAVEFVQDSKDPLKVEAVVTSKTDAQVADEKAAAAQASIDAQAQYEADRQAKRDEITKAFPDKEQAEAIGKLFDLRTIP
jgi:hypothetical protein